ncbi:MAG TPA: hypothetical protein PK413_16205 [Thermoanaerobaculia bacterium]|nr:hypothetical protein [Thermoanaerobaculia bacterium]
MSRLESEIIVFFEEHGTRPEVAAPLLEEAVTLMLFRWGEISNPEAWLMEFLEARLRRPPRNEQSEPDPAETTET